MGFEDLIARFDCYPAAEAVARAWQPIDPRRFGTWHRSAREEVAYLMPLLARALDRLLAEAGWRHAVDRLGPVGGDPSQ